MDMPVSIDRDMTYHYNFPIRDAIERALGCIPIAIQKNGQISSPCHSEIKIPDVAAFNMLNCRVEPIDFDISFSSVKCSIIEEEGQPKRSCQIFTNQILLESYIKQYVRRPYTVKNIVLTDMPTSKANEEAYYNDNMIDYEYSNGIWQRVYLEVVKETFYSNQRNYKLSFLKDLDNDLRRID